METIEIFNEITPFTGLPEPIKEESPAVLAEVMAQREIAEVQAAMTIAKRFPRNQAKATDRVLIACQRPTLAEGALYTYARGGTDISGPSIRLAEAIIQQWGNAACGIRELEQRLGESTVEAYAWDLETNTRINKVFQVRHIRKTKAKGTYSLDDPRDIYEMVANQGARRLRACILAIIPGDVVEAAVEQCEATLKSKANVTPETIKKMVSLFEGYGVSREMIEVRIQRKLESITSAQVISLRKIYNSLKDGMSKPQDWFDVAAQKSPDDKPKTTDKPKRGRPPKAPSPEPQETPPAPTTNETPDPPQNESGGPDLGEVLTELEGKGWPIKKLEIKFGMKAEKWGDAELSKIADMAADPDLKP